MDLFSSSCFLAPWLSHGPPGLLSHMFSFIHFSSFSLFPREFCFLQNFLRYSVNILFVIATSLNLVTPSNFKSTPLIPLFRLWVRHCCPRTLCIIQQVFIKPPPGANVSANTQDIGKQDGHELFPSS